MSMASKLSPQMRKALRAELEQAQEAFRVAENKAGGGNKAAIADMKKAAVEIDNIKRQLKG